MVITLSLAKGLDKMHVKYISSKRTGEDCFDISSKGDDDVEKMIPVLKQKKKVVKVKICSHDNEQKSSALRNLIPCAQFKKRQIHPWRSVTFCKVAG